MSEKPRAITITEPVSITVDGEAVTAQKGEMLIDAAERAGSYIPRFCYHPRMTPVGMCRMCLVEVDSGRGPALQPSCMLECADGMIVDTRSEKVAKAQDGVLEFLLINHPLDCPVCDKGGECPLQDQTVAYGPGESRFVEEKRHYPKPIPISETVALDRERCILCDRCTRFADEVAGDPLIHFMGRGAGTEVNTFPDQPFSSYFSGNTVQICPVGALTATPYRFKARPWDLDSSESTCTGCSVGCRITIQTSRNQVLRYLGVDSDPVNWSWMCDKGRFGFEATGSPDRLDAPLVRDGDDLVESRWTSAIARAAELIRGGLDRSGPRGVGVIGGARLTNESAYAWAKLAKGVIGTDHVDAQLGDGLDAAAVSGLPRATIDDACRPGGTVIYLGPDPKEELGVLYIRLRHAAKFDGVSIVTLAPGATALATDATATVTYRPGRAAAAMEALFGSDPDPTAVTDVDAARDAARIVDGADGDVVVVLGRPSLAESGSTIVDAAAVALGARPEITFLPALRRSNVMGAIDAGLAPGLLPGRVARSDGEAWFTAAWGAAPDADGLDTAGILRSAADGHLDTLILLGADPLSDFPDRTLAERALTGARNVIAVDTFLTPSSQRADVVLAAAGFAEVDGTTTNLEGRVTTVTRTVTPPGTARADWALAADLAVALDADLGFADAADVAREFEELSVLHAGVTAELLAESDHADGVVVPLPAADPAPDDESEPEAAGETGDGPANVDIDASDASDAEEGTGDDSADVDGGTSESADLVEAPSPVTFTAPPRTAAESSDSYSFGLVVSRSAYDHGTQLQHCPSSASLATGTDLRLNPAELDKLGVASGDRVRVTSERGSITLPVIPDAGVARGLAQVRLAGGDVTPFSVMDDSVVAHWVRLEVAR